MLLMLVGAFAFAGRIALVRDQLKPAPIPPPPLNLQVKLETPNGIKSFIARQFPNFDIFNSFPMAQKFRGRQNMKILVLKVEFVEDGDSITTGTGKMDLIGFGSPGDGLNYDPPHTKAFFNHEMQFLSNYYKSNSFGDCVVDWDVKPSAPTDNYQLPHKMVYYSGFDHFDAENGIVYFNSYGMEMGLVRILADAVAAADQDPSVDFSQYNGMIIFHAGTLMQSSFNFLRFGDIPSATVPSAAVDYYLGQPILANNGTDTIDYPVSINSEMARVGEYLAGNLGTICHEFGHILGLPDLYDVSGWSNGVGAWDIMGTGGWAPNPTVGVPSGLLPTNFGAWPRYALGWVNPLVVTRPESPLVLRASEIDTTQYALDSLTMIKIPVSATEFFLVENRQQDILNRDTIYVDVEDGVPISVDYGEYDFFLPGSGILVWHVDDEIVNAFWEDDEIQVNPRHKGVDLEEADGIQHFDAWYYADSLEYYGSRFDAFQLDDTSGFNHHFGSFTNPNSDAYSGKTLLDLEILTPRDTLMSFALKFDNVHPGFPVTVPGARAITGVSYADLNLDGRTEIIGMTEGGYLFAFDDTGGIYRSRFVGTRMTYPAIGDINADGKPEIVFGRNFQIHAVDGDSFFSLPNFPVTVSDAVVAAPMLFDLNGDGRDEIFFGSRDRRLYGLDGDGANLPNFPTYLNTEIFSTPCVFDPLRRRIGVLGSDGRFWLVDTGGVVKEFTNSQHNMVTYASPVVGDMDRDGEPEAVTINGYGTIYIYGADSLEQKFDILIDTTFYFTPALADLDRDGYLEIIMPNSSKTLYVTNRNGTAENNFPLHFKEAVLHPLLVADFDDDGRSDIVFGLGPEDSLSSGRLKIINDLKREFPYSPLFGEGGFSSPGAVFDLDHDGQLELACGTERGRLYVWDFPGTVSAWSGYMNSPKNWGYYADALVPTQPSEIMIGSFYIYPSPVERNGRVRFFIGPAENVQVDILDITGRKLKSAQVSGLTSQEYNEVEFDFSNQANGVYIVRVTAQGNGRREVKFKKFAVLKKGFGN